MDCPAGGRLSGGCSWKGSRAFTAVAAGALMSVQELSVEVQGEDIVVILPGTSFKVVYHKPADKPG